MASWAVQHKKCPTSLREQFNFLGRNFVLGRNFDNPSLKATQRGTGQHEHGTMRQRLNRNNLPHPMVLAVSEDSFTGKSY